MSDDSKNLDPSDATEWFWTIDQETIGTTQNRLDRLVLWALETEAGHWTPAKPIDFNPSRNLMQRWIDDGHLKVNDHSAKKNQSLRPGDRIRLTLPPNRKLDLSPINIPVPILFEDDEFVIVNKPQGLSVHPSSSESGPTLVHALLYHLKDLSSIGGVERPGIVHRLDKFTSGAMLVSKTDRAHRALSEALQAHHVERTYWALVYGTFEARTPLRIETFLQRHPTDRLRYSVSTSGKKAISHFRALQHFRLPGETPFMTWVECKLETGRTHQIRVHLDHLGHSIVGDPLYGKMSERHTKFQKVPSEIRGLINRLPGQALHSAAIRLKHPTRDEWIEREAPLPNEFSVLFSTLRERYAE